MLDLCHAVQLLLRWGNQQKSFASYLAAGMRINRLIRTSSVQSRLPLSMTEYNCSELKSRDANAKPSAFLLLQRRHLDAKIISIGNLTFCGILLTNVVHVEPFLR